MLREETHKNVDERGACGVTAEKEKKGVEGVEGRGFLVKSAKQPS
jgi:hypothetical protein